MMNDEEDESLEHFGIPGMKWGRRRRTSRNFGNDSHQANKNFIKVGNSMNRAHKLNSKSVAAGPTPKGQRLFDKSQKTFDKAEKAYKRHYEFLNGKNGKGGGMLDRYKNVKVSELTEIDKKIGRAYIEFLIQD